MSQAYNPQQEPSEGTELKNRKDTALRSAQAHVPARTATDVSRVPFQPAQTPELYDGSKDEKESKYLGRILILSTLSVLLFGFIYLFMENPYGWSNLEVALSWKGLFVYSSIVALVLFLGVLLMRYFGVLFGSYLYAAKYTADEKSYKDQYGPDAFLPPVTVVIPAYNEGVLIEETVNSLLELDYPEYEIVIVDDGSTDETNAIAQGLVGDYSDATKKVAVKTVTKPNGGKATALNAGIQVSSYEFILCVDGDSEITPPTLRRAIRHFVNPRIGAVAGNVKVKNRNNLWTKLQALEYVEGLNMVRSAQSSISLVNIIPGPVGLFRKQAIFDAGWYSADTFAEDCDITLKVLRQGWRVVYEPEAVSWTEAPEKLTNLLKQRYRWTRGIIQAVRKHKELFFNPTINAGGTLVMWSMAFESLIWPVMNVFANLYFVGAATLGYSYYLVFWWLSLTLLDLAAALYCIATEKEQVSLLPYVLLYRVFFILIIDVCKCLATIEELLGFGMQWGKLERIGGTPTNTSTVAPSVSY